MFWVPIDTALRFPWWIYIYIDHHRCLKCFWVLADTALVYPDGCIYIVVGRTVLGPDTALIVSPDGYMCINNCCRQKSLGPDTALSFPWYSGEIRVWLTPTCNHPYAIFATSPMLCDLYFERILFWREKMFPHSRFPYIWTSIFTSTFTSDKGIPLEESELWLE